MNWFRLLVKKVVCFFITVFYPYKVHNKENLIQGKCVLIGNHFRIIDCVPIFRMYHGKAFFLVKKEAFKGKLFSSFLKNYGAISVDRDNIEMKTVMEGMRVLKNGYPLTIYPEGTRNKKNEDIQPIKGGAVLFALKTNAPVVPIITAHKQRIFRKTHLIIGKPVNLDEYYGKKATSEDFDKITEILYQAMVDLRCELLKILDSKKKKVKN